jgi:hypothetical protein
VAQFKVVSNRLLQRRLFGVALLRREIPGLLAAQQNLELSQYFEIEPSGDAGSRIQRSRSCIA